MFGRVSRYTREAVFWEIVIWRKAVGLPGGCKFVLCGYGVGDEDEDEDAYDTIAEVLMFSLGGQK